MPSITRMGKIKMKLGRYEDIVNVAIHMSGKIKMGLFNSMLLTVLSKHMSE